MSRKLYICHVKSKSAKMLQYSDIYHQPTLESISNEPIPYDFVICIDDSKYMCHKKQLFPFTNKITPDMNSFTIEKIKDPNHDFQLILDLLNGKSIEITKINSYFINACGQELGMQALIDATDPYCRAPVTTINVLDVIRTLAEHNLNYLDEADFIAENFMALKDKRELKTLPIEVLHAILESNKFSYQNEEEFFHWINSVVSTSGSSYNVLFGYCYFEKLSKKTMKEFVDVVSYDSIHAFIWNSLKSRLVQNIISAEEEEEEKPQIPQFNPTFSPNPQALPPKPPIVSFMPQQSNQQQFAPTSFQGIEQIQKQQQQASNATSQSYAGPEEDEEEDVICLEYDDKYLLDGVINYIKREAGLSWQDEIIIEGGGTKNYQIARVVDYEHLDTWWDNYDSSKMKCLKENAWIQFEFVNYLLELQHYTLVSTANRPRQHQPKSWIIEGSNDGSSWEVVETVNNCDEMNVKNATKTFKLAKPSRPLRFFKFTLKANHARPDGPNIYELSLGAIEFYGRLFPDY